MHTNVIKETIQLDKLAREKVSQLETEKASIEERVKKDEKALIKSNRAYIDKMVADTQATYEKTIEEKKAAEIIKFNEALENIKKQFESKKNQWVKEILEFCKK